MQRPITELEPKSLWHHFYQLTQIPRPSHHERGVQDYVMGVADALGLEVIRDEVDNIIIRKPASKGMEDRAGVILQGHLDMVPQANSGVKHDFTRDAIETLIDGDWVKAVNTTLGADNGIGVAAALAVLDSKDIKHGPVEALFTSNEEDGMTGAFGLKPGVLHGGILLNLDSEDEGVLSICCAGGTNVNSRMPITMENTDKSMTGYRLSITGLRGGHSGVDIHRGRGNANKLLFRLLSNLAQNHGVRIADIQGGNLRNAIPRESSAYLCVPNASVTAFEQTIENFRLEITNELKQVEEKLKLTIQPVERPESVLAIQSQQRLLDVVCACPHGVMRMSDVMQGMVETSTNLAVVRMKDGYVEVLNLVRSSVLSAMNDLCLSIKGLFNLAGAETTIDGQYPGWQPNLDSAILQTMKEAYQYCFNEEVVVGGIHAGLECGILGATYPAWDMISFGPTIRFPHSPDEQVHIPSVRRFWHLLVRTLSEVPQQG